MSEIVCCIFRSSFVFVVFSFFFLCLILHYSSLRISGNYLSIWVACVWVCECVSVCVCVCVYQSPCTEWNEGFFKGSFSRFFRLLRMTWSWWVGGCFWVATIDRKEESLYAAVLACSVMLLLRYSHSSPFFQDSCTFSEDSLRFFRIPSCFNGVIHILPPYLDVCSSFRMLVWRFLAILYDLWQFLLANFYCDF